MGEREEPRPVPASARAISYSTELDYLRDAVREQDSAHRLICSEMDAFAPPTREVLIDQLTFQHRFAPDPNSLRQFIENQADTYLSSPSLQLMVVFQDRYAVRKTISVLAIHAFCEGLINAVLAVGLDHIGKAELFGALESCSLIEKWEICPKSLFANYHLEKSTQSFHDLKKLCRHRNAATHHKIELRDKNGDVVLKGNMSGISLGKNSRKEIQRLFELPRRLHKLLIDSADDRYLKSKIKSLYDERYSQ